MIQTSTMSVVETSYKDSLPTNYLQKKSILLFSMGYPKNALIKEWLYNEAGIVGDGADDDTILTSCI